MCRRFLYNKTRSSPVTVSQDNSTQQWCAEDFFIIKQEVPPVAVSTDKSTQQWCAEDFFIIIQEASISCS